MTRILLALALCFPFVIYSQPYPGFPSRPIRLLVTYPAGGGADGHTLMIDATNHAVNPSLLAKLPYDPDKAFTPVTLLALFPNVVLVHPSNPVSSIRELV
jgi:tripartite-type tricarboxylate transporter receptor subunit TctC